MSNKENDERRRMNDELQKDHRAALGARSDSSSLIIRRSSFTVPG
jgi:hypothetical protein